MSRRMSQATYNELQRQVNATVATRSVQLPYVRDGVQYDYYMMQHAIDPDRPGRTVCGHRYLHDGATGFEGREPIECRRCIVSIAKREGIQ